MIRFITGPTAASEMGLLMYSSVGALTDNPLAAKGLSAMSRRA
ncbi:hypothetical protein O1M63_28990 [Streptomyces mirabilis]|nr:hypothetical protein [Streptomyces mirabilis]